MIRDVPEDAVEATPEEGVEIMLKLAQLGPVAVETRRSGWSCSVWLDHDVAYDDVKPTERGYGYHHGPHGAAATCWAKLKERGLVE